MRHFVYPLSYIKELGCDVTDFIVNLIVNIDKHDDALKTLCADFRAEAKKEWFASREEAEAYYSIQENKEKLLTPSTDKLNPKYLIKLYGNDEMMKVLLQRMTETAADMCRDNRYSKEVFIKLFKLSCQRIFYMDIKDKDLNELSVKEISVSQGVYKEINQYLPHYFPKFEKGIRYVLNKDLFKTYTNYLKELNSKDPDYLSNPESRSTFLYTRFISYFYELQPS